MSQNPVVIAVQSIRSPSSPAVEVGQVVSASGTFAVSGTLNSTYSISCSGYLHFNLVDATQLSSATLQTDVSIGNSRINGGFEALSVPGVAVMQSGPNSVSAPVQVVGAVAGTVQTVGSSGIPPGLAVAINASTQAITVSVTNPATLPGTYCIPISASVAGTGTLPYSQNTCLYVVVLAGPQKDISVGPMSDVSLRAGSSSTFSMTVSPVNQYSGTVSLALDSTTPDSGGNLQLQYSPATLNLATGAKTTQVTVTAGASTSIATYIVGIRVSDTAGGINPHIPTARVTVLGGLPGTYSVAPKSLSMSMKVGTAGSTSIVLSGGAGYIGSATVTVSGVSPGLTVTLGNNGGALSNSSSITVPILVSTGVGIGVGGCACGFVIRINDGMTPKDVQVTVNVTAPDPLTAQVEIAQVVGQIANNNIHSTQQPFVVGKSLLFRRAIPDNGVGAETFQWRASIGPWTLPTLSPTDAWFYYTPTQTGRYCVNLTITDGLNRAATVNTVCAIVDNSVSVTIQDPKYTFTNTALTLTAKATGGSGTNTYAWTGATPINTDATATFGPKSSAGSYSVSVTATDTVSQKTSTDLITVQVYDPISINFSGLPSNPKTTVGQSLAMKANVSGGSGTGYVFQWTSAAPNSSQPSIAVVTPSSMGMTTVSVKVIDSLGNFNTAQVTIDVRANSGLRLQISSAGKTGPGRQMAMNASAVNVSGTVGFTWNGASATTSNGDAALFSAPTQGVYIVNVTAADSLGNTTGSSVVYVVPICGTAPTREFIRVGGKVIATEDLECTQP